MKSRRELVCWKFVSIQCDFCSCLCVWGNPCLCLIFVQSVVCGLTFSVHRNHLSSLVFLIRHNGSIWNSFNTVEDQNQHKSLLNLLLTFCMCLFGLIWNSPAFVVRVGAGVPLCLFWDPRLCVCVRVCYALWGLHMIFFKRSNNNKNIYYIPEDTNRISVPGSL